MLRYPGSKRRLCAVLDAALPPDVTSVAAPFFGSGAYEFHLARRNISVVGADIDIYLVNYFNMLCTNAAGVAEKILKIGISIDRPAFSELREALLNRPRLNSVTNAAIYFILNRTSYNGIMAYFTPGTRITQLAVQRLRRFSWPPALALLECCDVFEFLEKHGDKYWFLDPPYYGVRDGLYGLKRTNHAFDHERLAEFLRSRPAARWMLTYNDTPEIRALYSFARIIAHDVMYKCKYTTKREVIILSPA